MCLFAKKCYSHEKYVVQHIKIFAHMKKKQYLCSVKDEFKKYLESETRINNQEFHIREIGFKICIALIILGLSLFAFAMYMALA